MVSQRITKNGSDVHIDYRRTVVGQKAVSVLVAKLWNSIPMNIRNSNTISLRSKVICIPTPPRAPISEQSKPFKIKIGLSSVRLHNVVKNVIQINLEK